RFLSFGNGGDEQFEHLERCLELVLECGVDLLQLAQELFGSAGDFLGGHWLFRPPPAPLSCNDSMSFQGTRSPGRAGISRRKPARFSSTEWLPGVVRFPTELSPGGAG